MSLARQEAGVCCRDGMCVLTPDSIRDHRFFAVVRGYDRVQVDQFLGQLAELVDGLQRQVEALQRLSAAADAAPRTAYERIGAQVEGILARAYRSGVEVRREAKARAEGELDTASRQATALVTDGQRRREVIEGVVELLEERRAAHAEHLTRATAAVERTVEDLGPSPFAGSPAARAAAYRRTRARPDDALTLY